FHDGELGNDTERMVERHMASCEVCRLELKEIRELSALADQIGQEGMSPLAVRRIHKAIDAEQQNYSIFRIARVLTGLAASAMVVGAAWLWDVPDSGHQSKHVIVRIDPGPTDKWEYLAVNLKPDPLPTERWEANNQQMLADARFSNWMIEGLGGSGR
ncbi:MAG TPA: zf-HC2 domain-containing protein, partial [Humisphaera sp.]|nr:zf-HC2 domain-containing protein [Humisphaera sp.]